MVPSDRSSRAGGTNGGAAAVRCRLLLREGLWLPWRAVGAEAVSASLSGSSACSRGSIGITVYIFCLQQVLWDSSLCCCLLCQVLLLTTAGCDVCGDVYGDVYGNTQHCECKASAVMLPWKLGGGGANTRGGANVTVEIFSQQQVLLVNSCCLTLL